MKNRVISFVLTVGAIYLMKDFITARAQLFTFILFVLTIYFIEMFLETKKKRYAVGLVIIPILIANFHAAVFPFYFVLYLPYIAEYVIYLIANSGIMLNKIKIKRYTNRSEGHRNFFIAIILNVINVLRTDVKQRIHIAYMQKNLTKHNLD